MLQGLVSLLRDTDAHIEHGQKIMAATTSKDLIHPFRDGNDRTSRLFMNLELMRAGFPTVIIPVEDRAAYYENFGKAGKDADYAPCVQQLARLVERSFDPYWYLLGIA